TSTKQKQVSDSSNRFWNTRAHLRRRTRPPARWAASSEASKRAQRFPSSTRLPLSANSNNNSFNPKTQKKAWTLTSTSESRNLQEDDLMSLYFGLCSCNESSEPSFTRSKIKVQRPKTKDRCTKISKSHTTLR